LRWEAQRAECAVYEGEPLVLLFHTRRGRETLEAVVRLEEEEGRVARLRSYGFCPEVVRAVGEALGREVLTGLYRYPTPEPGRSYSDWRVLFVVRPALRRHRGPDDSAPPKRGAVLARRCDRC
jgi:hypothetical protein